MTTICDAVEVWENWYKPITNKFISDDETKLFETYGEEFDYVLNSSEKNVWTWVDGSDGTYIVSGIQFVNRIGYFVTEEEWQSPMVVPYEKYETVGVNPTEFSYDEDGVEVELLYELCEVARNTFGENAVEALVGALSKVVTLKQLQTLVTKWKELKLEKQSEYITNHD